MKITNYVENLEFNVEDLFILTETKIRKKKSPILSPRMNLKARCKNNKIGGFGIYGITYNPTSDHEHLIYIGKFQGSSKKGRYKGNIVKDRWQKHLYTITMRGHNVAVDSKNAFDQAQRIARDANLQLDDTFISIQGEEKSQLFEKNGCQASYNRMMFAIQNSSQLNPSDTKPEYVENFYKLFKFYYWRVVEQKNDRSSSEKVDLKKIEDSVISEFHDRLPCNKEYKHGCNDEYGYLHYNPEKMIMKNSQTFGDLSLKIQRNLLDSCC